MMSIEESLLKLKSAMYLHEDKVRPLKIAYYGDSLARQYTVSCQCQAEQHNVTALIEAEYVYSRYLLKKIRANNNSTSFTEILDYDEKDEDVIVLTAGPWYSHSQMNDTQGTYRKMLEVVEKTVSSKWKKRNITTVWMALPPMSIKQRGDWSWDSFRLRNAMAKDILKSVLYFDPNTAVAPRKVAHPKWSRDGLHWCQPAKTDAPTFINEAMFHALANGFTNL